MPLHPPPFIPPAPLPPPPVPVAPDRPAPLPVRDVLGRLGAAVGLFVAGGVLGYLGLRAFLVGWLEPCAATLVWGTAGVLWLAAGAVLVPFYAEWRAVQTAHTAQQIGLYHTQRHYAQALRHDRQWAALYLRDRTPADPPVRVTHMGRVVSVDTPAQPPADTPTSVVNRARAAVADFLHRAAEPDPPPERITTRLDALPPGPPPPRIPYSVQHRMVVDCFLTTGTCTGPQALALGISDRQWRKLCATLEEAGVLVSERGKERRLATSLQWVQRDYDNEAVHRRVAARLAK